MRLIALNKPFDVLCQFTQGSTPPADRRTPRRTLADLQLPPAVYPAGRLDRDSEGLLLLTGEGVLQQRLSNPAYHLAKRYRVQVEGLPEEAALQALRDGVALKDGAARALHARALDEPAWPPWTRDPPIRIRRQRPTRWLELSIDEGRNRQVRRMTAAVGHPTLRLIRTAIGPFDLHGLLPGEWREIDAGKLAQLPRPARRSHRKRGRGSRQLPRSTE